jgi:hypothetical protein
LNKINLFFDLSDLQKKEYSDYLLEKSKDYYIEKQVNKFIEIIEKRDIK